MSVSSPDERCFRCQTALPPHAVYCVDCGTCQLATTDTGTVVTRSPYEPRPPEPDAGAEAAGDDFDVDVDDDDCDGVEAIAEAVAPDCEPPAPEAPVVEAVPARTTQPLLSDTLQTSRRVSERTGRYDLRALQRLIALGPAQGAMSDTADIPVDEPPPRPKSLRADPEVVAGDIEVIDDDPTPDPYRPVPADTDGPRMPYFVRPKVRRRAGELQPPELRWRPYAPSRITVRTPSLQPEPGAPRAEWGKPAPKEETVLSAAPPRPTPYWEAPAKGSTHVGPAPTAAGPS